MRVTVDRPRFLSEEILNLMGDRDESFKIARGMGDEASWTQAKELRKLVSLNI